NIDKIYFRDLILHNYNHGKFYKAPLNTDDVYSKNG
ncbi:hypothetical protein EZS27_033853, partial [termite gut metagenome]